MVQGCLKLPKNRKTGLTKINGGKTYGRHAKEVGQPRILETASGRSLLKGHHATKLPFESAGPEKLQHSFLS